ncbi:hypothetical protein ACE1CD_15440 [Aerosakkonema sp. BLCC-F183]|uniref:hypothetical protein n=1 Tax=Aerosakkonema sp. BLCC-F183 TaxID=3342834 RepID=UPI0035B94653
MNQQALSRILELRVSIDKTQHEIDMLMPDAIEEALKLHEYQPKSKIVFQTEQGRIVLCLRKRFCTPDDDAKLSRIDADIKARTSQLAQKHSAEIEQIETRIQKLREAIEQLEAKRDKLLCDRYIIRLKKEYLIQQENSCYWQPNLSVFLK